MILDQAFVYFVDCLHVAHFFFYILYFFSSTLFVFSTTHPIFNVIFCNINEVMKIVLYAFQLLSSWSQFAFCFILSYVFFFSHSLIFFLETFSLKPFSFNAKRICLFKIRDYPSNLTYVCSVEEDWVLKWKNDCKSDRNWSWQFGADPL